MNKCSIRDLDVKGKKVFLRVDLNVTLNKDGEIIEENKIRSAVPTIEYLVNRGAKVIVASHLGRPKGKVKEELRLDPVARKLAQILKKPVYKIDEVVGDKAQKAVGKIKDGEILMLENVRFHPGETKNAPELARQYAKMADIYVNDAFGTAHRAHASTEGAARLLPSAVGLNMEREIKILSQILETPERPLAAVMGGTKVADKIGLIKHFLEIVDCLLIGGGMANTFLKAKGYSLGKSFVEEDKVEEAGNILKSAEKSRIELILPVDFVAAAGPTEEADRKVVPFDSVPDDWMALDIGPETVELFCEKLKNAKTIVWNGPLGMVEVDSFAQGTMRLAHFIADLNIVSVIGGGDIVAAVEKAGVDHKMTHISTGGGATLEFWEGKELPALVVIQEKATV